MVLKHSVLMNPERLVIGRGMIFDKSQTRASSLGGGAEVWVGYSQSLRPSQGGLTLNIDMACTAFLERQPVVNFLAAAAGVPLSAIGSGMSPDQLKRARRAIQGLQALLMLTSSHSLSCRGRAWLTLSPCP